MTIAFAATLLILFIGWAGSALGLQYLLGVILPLVAGAVFIIGFIWKIICWAKSPVPFAIPTVAGQQRSHDWIKPNRLECPWTTSAVVGRMILEVFAFRSLFRNTRAERTTIDGTPRVTYFSNKWLWVFALLFHYSMLVIIIRHARFFLDPVPACIAVVEFVDGVFQIAHNVDILADFQEYTGHTGVLADGNIFAVSNVVVFNDLVQNALGNSAVLASAAILDRALYVGGKMVVSIDTKLFNGIDDLLYVNFAHFR